MRVVDLIRAVRDGADIDVKEIAEFVDNVAKHKVEDYQVSAFLMAVFFKGLKPDVLAQLTISMRDSGSVLEWDPQEKHLYCDKHSTGGVGDKVSLVLAPLAAACGVKVPMISGRGLGHTGGTLDKLESIPGFKVDLPIETVKEQVSGPLGFAMIGQSESIAPVDRLLYAMRDVTATVESVPLIASSIMSKKTAAGLAGLVLDLKVGNGAFMKTADEALELANAIKTIGHRVGLKVSVLVTDMNQPLGEWVGNYSEMFEALAILKGKDTPAMAATRELTIELTSHMIAMAQSVDLAEARKLAESKLKSGEALAKFEEMVAVQGGDLQRCQTLEDHIGTGIPVKATQSGYVQGIETMQLGTLGMELGGGRATVTDKIDYNVSIQILKKLGDRVETGDEIIRLYVGKLPALFRDQTELVEAATKLYTIGPEKPAASPLIIRTLSHAPPSE